MYRLTSLLRASGMAGSRRPADTIQAFSLLLISALASSSARLFPQWEGWQLAALAHYPPCFATSAARGVPSCSTHIAIPERKWDRACLGWTTRDGSLPAFPEWAGGWSLSSKKEMAVYKKWHEHLMARSKGSLLQRTEACLCCWEDWIIFSYHRPGLFRRGQKRWNDYMCFSNTNLANPRDKRSVFPSISKSLNIYNLKMANE